MHLGNRVVDQWLQAITVPVNAELSSPTQSRGRKQNVLDKGQNPVFLHDFGRRNGFAYLPGDNLRGVKKVDLTVC